MIQLTKNGLETTYNIDEMLYNDTVWLSKQIKENSEEFIKVASQLDLRQEDWDMFWKRVRAVKSIVEKADRNIDVILNGKETKMTKEEFEFAQFYLGEAEKVSNCCGVRIRRGGVCSDCGGVCEAVYVLEN